MAPDTATLEEAGVRLLPYARGLYSRDALYHLWQMVEASGTGQQIFYAQACPDETWRGDLVEFVTYFSDPGRQLLIVCKQADELPFGLVWFDRVQGQSHALMGLWYQRHTTRLAREGTTLAMQYAFTVLGYDRLCGFTPWRTAVQHVLPLGWTRVATLPGFVQIQGQARDIYVLQKDRPPLTVGSTAPCLGHQEEFLYGVESWRHLAPELLKVWDNEHAPELAPFPGKDATLWTDRYAQLDAEQVLHCLTVRHHGELVGYYVSILSPFINAKRLLTSIAVLYYVRPAWRRHGIGRQLVLLYEHCMRTLGVHVVASITKHESPHGTFLRHLGWTEHEHTYLKWIAATEN